ncbi:MAG: hypothetical protein DWQ05_04240 [Calditrichaeota bacterium]|nr:MAG: hypothetical protein DWQ05_04240 [Calditrichota bacterium]
MPDKNQDLPPINFVDDVIEIPEIFHSNATGEKFEKCLVCEKDLLDERSLYVIEKAVKRYKKFNTTDTLYEYAMCIQCHEEMLTMFSDESRQRLESYFKGRVDLAARRRKLLENEKRDVADWIDSCIIKNKPSAECDEFQIMCECTGAKMLFTYSPIMICDEVAAEMAELLSAKTRDDIGRFKDEYLGIPPELKINPRQPEPFLI